MYNPEQARDADGRWTRTKATHSFLTEHGDELAIGLAVAGALAIGYGAFVAVGTEAAVTGLGTEAATVIKAASTVRKVGPVALEGIGKVIPPLQKFGLKSGEAFQYSKGFFSPNLADDALEVIPRGIKGLRVGGEVVTKTGTKAFGAPRPLLYDKMVFTQNKNAAKIGGALVTAGGVTGGYSKLHKRKS